MAGTRIWLPPGVVVGQNSKAAESANPLLHAIHFRALLNFARAVIRAQRDWVNCRQSGNYPERDSGKCRFEQEDGW